MRALSDLFLAGSALLGTAGCLPDYSPDLVDRVENAASTDSGARDAGAKAGPRDAGSLARDATMTSEQRDAESPAPSDDAPPPDDPSAPPDEIAEPMGPCDLTGRYAVTEHFAMDGLGAKQIVQNWFYVELQQSGNQLTYKKSLSCGAQVHGATTFEVTIDDTAAWPAYTENPAYAGRKGTVEQVAEGCQVHFDKDAVVRGATVAYYRDLSHPLPKLEEIGSASSPGWEDWDQDGNPGVTLKVGGIAPGSLYAVMRNWTEYSGTVPDGADLLTMALSWGQSRSTLGYVGSPLLTADAAPDPDQTKQLVEFGKMTAEQTAGDDLSICQNVRDLAPTLTPNASAI